MPKSRAFFLSVPLLLAALVAVAPPAAAHEHVTVDDTYELTIGWISEPAYVDQPNGVWLRVESLAEEHAHSEHNESETEGAHGHGASDAVTGVEGTLNVTLSIAGKSKTFGFSPEHGEPGVYVARFIPTVSGTYTAHFVGAIGASAVDVTVDLQRVEAAGDVQFPEQTGSLYELRQQLDAQAADIAALKQQLDTKAATPADVDAAKGSDTPFVGVAALVAVGIVAATLMRRRA